MVFFVKLSVLLKDGNCLDNFSPKLQKSFIINSEKFAQRGIQCCSLYLEKSTKSKQGLMTITLIFAATPFSASLADDLTRAMWSVSESFLIHSAQAESHRMIMNHTRNNTYRHTHHTILKAIFHVKPGLASWPLDNDSKFDSSDLGQLACKKAYFNTPYHHTWKKWKCVPTFSIAWTKKLPWIWKKTAIM